MDLQQVNLSLNSGCPVTQEQKSKGMHAHIHTNTYAHTPESVHTYTPLTYLQTTKACIEEHMFIHRKC